MDLSNNIIDIYNGKKHENQKLYDAFNSFIFSNDRRVFAKLLYRYEVFQKIKHLPGDIVELGVFKGSGIATWAKICDLFIPHTNKKVIGFDLFSSSISSNVFSSYKNGHTMSPVIDRTTLCERSIQRVKEQLLQANISDDKYILIEGDVCFTTKEFVKNNPGFRISLLYLDLDLDEPTYQSLVNLWDRVVPGGYIIFDEYDYHIFDESNAVDRFLRDYNLKYKVLSTNIYAPSAYIIKE
jgi:hypothetical protein